jgi:hypothetical protein
VRRLPDPVVRIGVERVEREPAEFAAVVGDEIEARSVVRPRARNEERVVVVRRELAGLAALEVNEMRRGVAVVPELECQQLRAVG